jgi:hypothetical protein
VNSKTLTWVLAAVATALTVALVVVLLHRPQAQLGTAEEPVSSAPTTSAAPKPSTPGSQASDSEASQLPSSEVDAHDASPGATPYSQTDEARHQWEPVASGFGHAFTTTKGKTAGEWRSSLSPYVTDKVRDQLATVDVRNVPKGVYVNIEPAEYGDDKVAVFVHYDSDLTLVTYLILDGTDWRIYAYDRWEE